MAEKKCRRRYTGLVVLALLLAALVALALWQKNNIEALLVYKNAGSQEEIEQQMEQNQQAIADALEKNPEIVVRDLTEEEKQALRDGTLTQEELTERLTETPKEEAPKEEAPKAEEKGAEQKPAEPPKQEQKPAEEKVAEQPKVEEKDAEQPVESEYQKKLSAVTAKVYVLREKFTIELDAIKDEAASEYYAMSEEERTGDKLTAFAKKYFIRATELEKQCDAEMDAIIAEMDALISANNGDYSVIDAVVESYANEKSLKKAWYMAELKKRGLS